MDPVRRALATAALIAQLAAGCGPVAYIQQVTRKASADVDAARAAHGDTYAPFWYTLAVEFLVKAREEAAEANFQAASRLGQQASEAADKALEQALARGPRRARAVEEAPAGGTR
jgi:hypothetical protein